MILTRRAALLGLTSTITLGQTTLALASAATDRRFVVVILRGALDGMAAVVPYGDADLAPSEVRSFSPLPANKMASLTSAASTACIPP